jgi:mevalonate kinase
MNIRWNMQAVFLTGLCASGNLMAARLEAPSKKSALKRHQKAVAAKLDTLEQRSPFDLLTVSSSVRSLWSDTYAIINKGLVSHRSHKKLEKLQHAVRDARSAIMIVSRMRYDQRMQKKRVTSRENQEAVVHRLQEAIQHHVRVVKKIHAILSQEPCKSLSCAINREALTRLSEVVQSVLEEAQDILHKAEMVISYHVK